VEWIFPTIVVRLAQLALQIRRSGPSPAKHAQRDHSPGLVRLAHFAVLEPSVAVLVPASALNATLARSVTRREPRNALLVCLELFLSSVKASAQRAVLDGMLINPAQACARRAPPVNTPIPVPPHAQNASLARLLLMAGPNFARIALKENGLT